MMGVFGTCGTTVQARALQSWPLTPVFIKVINFMKFTGMPSEGFEITIRLDETKITTL
jgi:hypothetical protein